jgi:hypothetical protein
MPTYIIDIDDTLTMPSQLVKPASDSEWDELYRNAQPNELLIEQFKKKRELGDIVIVCTGRKEKNEDVTKEWLFGISIRHHILLMRDNNDSRPAVDVKRDHYIKIVNAIPEKVVLLIDDDDEVRAMARSLGIFALHPNEFIGVNL